MPFAIPTLQELVERGRGAFRAHLPGSDAWLWPNNINPSAKVMAGLTHEAFGYIDFVAKQKFALTADSGHLDLHGEEFGLARKPAGPAKGKVRLTATTAISVDGDAVFARTDGIEYRVLAGGSLPGAGTLDLDCIATSDGKNSIAAGNTPLAILNGVTGTATAAAHPDGILGGADVEDDEAFRARILFRKRNPPHGGAAADYVMWAGEVAGVTRVWVERLWDGPGSVRVFPLMDELYQHGIPPAAEITRVANYISTLRPAGAVVTVQAPVGVTINIEITDLLPDTTEIREIVLAELRETFRRLGRVAGIDTVHPGMPYLAVPSSFSRSWIWQAVANATGEERHVITAPAGDTALTAGQIATLGTVTFVTTP